MTETWKPIGPFAPNYSASSLGRIRNDKRRNVLRPTLFDRGYLYVGIPRGDGKRGCVQVHKLINIAFHGMPEPGQITRHLNCDRTDNRPTNLCWGSYQENAEDGLRNGKTAHGRAMNHGHLTEDQIVAIREERAAGTSIQVLGEKYGVAWAHISAICTGKWWTRAGGPITSGIHARRSSNSYNRKVTLDTARKMVERRKCGALLREIAAEFLVSVPVAHRWITRMQTGNVKD